MSTHPTHITSVECESTPTAQPLDSDSCLIGNDILKESSYHTLGGPLKDNCEQTVQERPICETSHNVMVKAYQVESPKDKTQIEKFVQSQLLHKLTPQIETSLDQAVGTKITPSFEQATIHSGQSVTHENNCFHSVSSESQFHLSASSKLIITPSETIKSVHVPTGSSLSVISKSTESDNCNSFLPIISKPSHPIKPQVFQLGVTENESCQLSSSSESRLHSITPNSYDTKSQKSDLLSLLPPPNSENETNLRYTSSLIDIGAIPDLCSSADYLIEEVESAFIQKTQQSTDIKHSDSTDRKQQISDQSRFDSANSLPLNSEPDPSKHCSNSPIINNKKDEDQTPVSLPFSRSIVSSASKLCSQLPPPLNSLHFSNTKQQYPQPIEASARTNPFLSDTNEEIFCSPPCVTPATTLVSATKLCKSPNTDTNNKQPVSMHYSKVEDKFPVVSTSNNISSDITNPVNLIEVSFNDDDSNSTDITTSAMDVIFDENWDNDNVNDVDRSKTCDWNSDLTKSLFSPYVNTIKSLSQNNEVEQSKKSDMSNTKDNSGGHYRLKSPFKIVQHSDGKMSISYPVAGKHVAKLLNKRGECQTFDVNIQNDRSLTLSSITYIFDHQDEKLQMSPQVVMHKVEKDEITKKRKNISKTATTKAGRRFRYPFTLGLSSGVRKVKIQKKKTVNLNQSKNLKLFQSEGNELSDVKINESHDLNSSKIELSTDCLKNVQVSINSRDEVLYKETALNLTNHGHSKGMKKVVQPFNNLRRDMKDNESSKTKALGTTSKRSRYKKRFEQNINNDNDPSMHETFQVVESYKQNPRHIQKTKTHNIHNVKAIHGLKKTMKISEQSKTYNLFSKSYATRFGSRNNVQKHRHSSALCYDDTFLKKQIAALETFQNRHRAEKHICSSDFDLTGNKIDMEQSLGCHRHKKGQHCEKCHRSPKSRKEFDDDRVTLHFEKQPQSCQGKGDIHTSIRQSRIHNLKDKNSPLHISSSLIRQSIAGPRKTSKVTATVTNSKLLPTQDLVSEVQKGKLPKEKLAIQPFEFQYLKPNSPDSNSKLKRKVSTTSADSNSKLKCKVSTTLEKHRGPGRPKKVEQTTRLIPILQDCKSPQSPHLRRELKNKENGVFVTKTGRDLQTRNKFQLRKFRSYFTRQSSSHFTRTRGKVLHTQNIDKEVNIRTEQGSITKGSKKSKNEKSKPNFDSGSIGSSYSNNTGDKVQTRHRSKFKSSFVRQLRSAALSKKSVQTNHNNKQSPKTQHSVKKKLLHSVVKKKRKYLSKICTRDEVFDPVYSKFDSNMISDPDIEIEMDELTAYNSNIYTNHTADPTVESCTSLPSMYSRPIIPYLPGSIPISEPVRQYNPVFKTASVFTSHHHPLSVFYLGKHTVIPICDSRHPCCIKRHKNLTTTVDSSTQWEDPELLLREAEMREAGTVTHSVSTTSDGHQSS